MGETAILRSEQTLELARNLVVQLEAGREEEALGLIEELGGFRDSIIYQKVGRLTRELHDAMDSFLQDSKLADIANSEMPDAAERLTHVIDMTEEAANATLSAVEDAMPLAQVLQSDSRRLADSWERFRAREMNVQDFRSMSRELDAFLRETQANADALNSRLSDVLMAQGYQDLTGQIIRKVIDLVHEVESKLVELIRLSGAQPAEERPKKVAQGGAEVHGPVVPGVDKVDAVNGQDQVDDLLSSLGF